jgi:hypothetical protein
MEYSAPEESFMSKFWSRLLWAIVFIYFLGMLVIWLIPERLGPEDAWPEERAAVEAQVKAANEALADVKITKVEAKSNRVVAVFATWIGESAHSLSDREAWNEEARKVAIAIGANYVPDNWHVNVALYYRRLPRGLVGMPAAAARDAARNLPTP